MQKTWVQSLGQEDHLEKEMATPSSILAWEIPWTEEPGGLPSMELEKSQTQLSSSRTTTSSVYSHFLFLPVSVSLASHFPQLFLSLSIINTNMKHCPFSLISPKNILHEALLRGYCCAWCGRQLKISRSVCVLVCPGWSCFWGVLTGHPPSLAPASHGWLGPSLDTLTSVPGVPLCVLTFHWATHIFKSFVFLYGVWGLPCGMCFFQLEYPELSYPKDHQEPFKKSPRPGWIRRQNQLFCLSFHYLCNGCAFSIMTLLLL